jgi:hypothetical protein
MNFLLFMFIVLKWFIKTALYLPHPNPSPGERDLNRQDQWATLQKESGYVCLPVTRLG